MHFSRPNNRPLEQGGHWERRVTVIGSTKTPKPLVIISSFLHQTQAYTDSRAATSCNTREENLANGTFSDEWGNFPNPSIWSHHASMVTQGVDFFFSLEQVRSHWYCGMQYVFKWNGLKRSLCRTDAECLGPKSSFFKTWLTLCLSVHNI